MCKGINNITLPVYKELMKRIEEGTLSKIEVSNIQSMSDEDLDKLKVGDVVQKKTGNQKHCYVVSYKEEHHGICLTYVDCGYMETISYDYTDGHWVFNSKDVQETQEKLVSGSNIKTINGTSLLGSGNIAVSGGTQIYRHSWRLRQDYQYGPSDYLDCYLDVFSTSSTPITLVDLQVIISFSSSLETRFNILGYGQHSSITGTGQPPEGKLVEGVIIGFSVDVVAENEPLYIAYIKNDGTYGKANTFYDLGALRIVSTVVPL